MTLIACHIWDTIGAVAAFIARKENEVLSVGPQPTYIGRDLNEIADQLIEKYS
ncbi:Haloacid dehalogenase, type II (fragment) [Legionella fallonii LLAP-10]|uniref:Haloacid dehalogenase, type II n=1 Tax=Legionella fallonii LLAP-10 TaxID=1212491 RepID=A0A098G773_9GAMM